MKILILAFLLITLSGCNSQVDGWEILKVEAVCKDRNGVDHISTILINTVTCGDGKVLRINNAN